MEEHFTPLPQNPDTTTVVNQPNNSKQIFIIVGVFLLLILAGIILSTRSTKEKTPEAVLPTISVKRTPTTVPTLIPYPTLGSMRLSTKDGAASYSVNSPVVIVLKATSDGKNIVSYDGIVSYDKQGFVYKNATSNIADFSVVPFDRGNYVAVSGIKSTVDNNMPVWSDTTLAEIEFMATKAGTYSFSLDPKGNDTSKLVDDMGQPVYPESSQLQLEIR
ncbi:hypothetical protein COY90_01255 [Candidatus Roizmanbacteria bacterium CG_4_10_14_0_8_um_filter_39_9]|uniref:Cohesin domain-containing protein n=1 Tax=Candidatus Roizmanbacteria bacterium CG_4_10_14_0_8_um_filter_39_9 TaxID=1974829 RepID=A0A2M7QEX4_9BACT|nr:MAG: hypothetical protein COY90_01255 [Candidatus Roizmanbacteria bacterium CG_4_10_14_0_8_um_filter_39_9]